MEECKNSRFDYARRKNSAVSNETEDYVENKTSHVVSKEVLLIMEKEAKTLDKNNHPDPVNKRSITEMEEGKMEEETCRIGIHRHWRGGQSCG